MDEIIKLQQNTSRTINVCVIGSDMNLINNLLLIKDDVKYNLKLVVTNKQLSDIPNKFKYRQVSILNWFNYNFFNNSLIDILKGFKNRCNI